MSDTTVGKIIIAVAVIICVIFLVSLDHPEGKTYDCGMAEWHPDIPIAVKEECRRIRNEEWKRRQNNEHQKVVVYYDKF